MKVADVGVGLPLPVPGGCPSAAGAPLMLTAGHRPVARGASSAGPPDFGIDLAQMKAKKDTM